MTINAMDQVNHFLDRVLRTETIEETFVGFIIESKENEEFKRKTYEQDFEDILSKIPSDQLDALLRQYIDYVGGLVGERQITALLHILENAVNTNQLQAKTVCEAVLTSPHLEFDNEVFWSAAFGLIHRIIASADYKGVRDQLKIMLDRIHSIPSQSNISALPILNNMYRVFELIFDRNASILPAYLVLDEIQKKMYPKGKWPHWKFAKLLSGFVDSFIPTAQMVTISGRCKLLPVVGYSSTHSGNSWKLDPISAKLQLRGLLPYSKELLLPQTELLRYVLEQPYSRDVVMAMLGLNNKAKQRCPILEEQLVELIILAMDKSEAEPDLSEVSEQGSNATLFMWQHLSSHLIYFVLFHYVSFPHMVLNLHSRLSAKNYQKGREHLMWILLQFISGAIQKNPLNDFLPILKLYDLLYRETEPLPLPDINKPGCTRVMSAASIWIHLLKKAETDQTPVLKQQRPLPIALSKHFEFLEEKLAAESLSKEWYETAVLCNAYSTTQEIFARPMMILVDAISRTPPPEGTEVENPNIPSHPLPMDLLDSLTVHTKMSLIHNIVTQIMKMAQNKATICPPPALVETYSRLLIYTETETLGIKGFMSQLLNAVYRSHSWSILHTLMEMFVYRLCHIPVHYRVQLLGSLNSLSHAPHTNHVQLQPCMEATTLKLIIGLTSSEVLAIPQFARYSDPKSLISVESEELNKVLVLTLARAIHVTGSETLSAAGNWCKELLSNIMTHTPNLTWSSYTLNCFPPVIADFFRQTSTSKENKDIKKCVEEEFKNWKAMSSESDKIDYFAQQGRGTYFLCLLWKLVLENEQRSKPLLPTVAYTILDRITTRGLSPHLRTFADYLVNELSCAYGGTHLKKYISALNDLIWKCNVITLDRFLLCLSLRAFEDNNSKVCFLAAMFLLEKPEFNERIDAFVSENYPEYWKQNDWHEKHLAFLEKYPETFSEEGQTRENNALYTPVHFSNICLRFIPVMDILIHRFIEVQSTTIPLETLLDRYGMLYRFHEKPITYLYNTLHFYEQKLRDRPALKKKLISSILGSFKGIRPSNWAVTEAYSTYMEKPEDTTWTPDLDYYIKLIQRLVDTLSGKNVFPHMDWRFSEFPNAPAHALHITCVELMALAVPASVVATNILDVCLVGHKVIPRQNIESWMNAVGLVLTALPEPYWTVLWERILEVMQSPPLVEAGSLDDPFKIMDFKGSHNCMSENTIGYMIGLTHAVWHHASVGQVSLLPTFLTEKVKPKLQTEEQFLFVCHLLGPFLQRFYVERTRLVMDVTIELYECLGIIDQKCEDLRFMDSITDLLYHIKYMFTGDSVKNEIEKSIISLRPALRLRLRFITHLNIEDLTTS